MKDYKQTEMFPQSSQEDSPAKTYPVQGSDRASMQNAQGCGQRCFDSSEMYGQRGQLLKMYQPLDLKALPWSYKISARSGMWDNFIVYPLVPLVLINRETGFGLWHTPLASAPSPSYEKRYPGGKTRKHPIPNLAAEVQEGIPYSVKSAMRKDPKIQWPTPTTQEIEHPNAEICPKSGRRFSKDGKSTHSLNLADTVKWRTPSANPPGINPENLVDKDGNPPKRGQRVYDKKTGRLAQIGLEQQVRMWPTPCSNTRPNEGNVRLLRAKVMAGELSREEAKAMLNGKDPFEAQGVIPAMKWPTPTANSSIACSMEAAKKEAERLHPQGRYTLATKVATDPTTWWPTPTARDYKDTAKNWEDLAKYEHKKRLACSVAADSQTSGQLNPTWVEWLMGFPSGWTDLSNSETV